MSVQVSDIHGWGIDPDLRGLDPTWPVEVRLIEVYEIEAEYVYDPAQADEYAKRYRTYGPWALPPIVCMGDGSWQLAGAHRMRAAYIAELPFIPAFIVQPIKP